MQAREVREVRRAQPTRDGAGVAISRVAGMGHPGMDPVLMLDELRSRRREDFVGGFPPHPHRGMQTLTYMKRGGIVHEDSLGNRGEIRGGGAQWMSAGSGVIHSEMPTPDSGELHGFQIWINLPAAAKLRSPRYRDVPGDALAVLRRGPLEAVAIAGDWDFGALGSVAGPLGELAETAAVLDLRLAPRAGAEIRLNASDSALAYVYAGALAVRGGPQGEKTLLVTGPGEYWRLQAAPSGASVLLLRGEPIREPVAHHGPFVMNTREEIEQAIRDYASGRFAPGE